MVAWSWALHQANQLQAPCFTSGLETFTDCSGDLLLLKQTQTHGNISRKTICRMAFVFLCWRWMSHKLFYIHLGLLKAVHVATFRVPCKDETTSVLVFFKAYCVLLEANHSNIWTIPMICFILSEVGDYNIDSFVQDCSMSSPLAMELLQSRTKPWIWLCQL